MSPWYNSGASSSTAQRFPHSVPHPPANHHTHANPHAPHSHGGSPYPPTHANPYASHPNPHSYPSSRAMSRAGSHASHTSPAGAPPSTADPLNDYFAAGQQPTAGGPVSTPPSYTTTNPLAAGMGNDSRSRSTSLTSSARASSISNGTPGTVAPARQGSLTLPDSTAASIMSSAPSSTLNSIQQSSFTPPQPTWASQTQPLEIVLDSDTVVLRGQGGEMNPAYVSGHVSLVLQESTNIKDITMNLSGKAKVSFQDGASHSFTHNLISKDWSFLPDTGTKRHIHTLKAGHHTFPFQFEVSGALPSSLTTFSGDGNIQYKLRATMVRSGLGFNLHASKTFDVVRTFTPEALEFNQTLEIENTWPGKIMYSLTLPFKAYAAGDSIPVLIKFMPIAKGVKVLSVTSVLKEYTVAYTRGSSHASDRVAASVKHEIWDGEAVCVERELLRPPTHWHGVPANQWVPPDSPPLFTSPSGRTSAEAGPSTGEEVLNVDENGVVIGDNEVNTSLTIPIPPWTSATHAMRPVYVTHKIKWSCSIANADGHISELRCALPIHILDNVLLDEARASGAPTRSLLTGADVEESQQRIDLPSYSNHVYDRVAVPEAGTSGFTFRSAQVTPHHSPSHTPSGSRRNSLDGTEVPPRRQLGSDHETSLLRSLGALATGSGSRHTSGSISPGTPPTYDMHARSSRSSRPSSRANSRPSSRASSPDRSLHGHASQAQSPAGHDDARPHPERRGTGGLSSLLRPLSALSGGLSPMLRGSSSNGGSPVMSPTGPNVIPGPMSAPISRNSNSFASLPPAAERQTTISFAASSLTRPVRDPPGARFHLTQDDEEDEEELDEEVTALSRVPSYNDELGAFVVPLDPSLPTYDSSEQMERDLVRARSESDLRDVEGEDITDAPHHHG